VSNFEQTATAKECKRGWRGIGGRRFGSSAISAKTWENTMKLKIGTLLVASTPQSPLNFSKRILRMRNFQGDRH
jgi:hypothetical protein